MIDDKQFIIGNEPVNKKDWKKIVLANKKILSFQEKLHVSANESLTVILIGEAWSIKSIPPEKVILQWDENTSLKEIYDEEQYWCGRYLLVVGDLIFLDAMGSLGIFYTSKLVGSSIKIICELTNREIVYPNIKHGDMPDYIPGPYTSYEGIMRLLPSQIYNMVLEKVIRRPLLPSKIIVKDNLEKQAQELVRYYVASLSNMKAHFPKHRICLALTGGRDSRAVMAMLEKTGNDYTAFTCEHANLTMFDRYIPAKLAKKVNRDFYFIRRNKNKYSKERYEEYKKQTSGYAVDEDLNFWAFGQYQELPKLVNENVLILRGAGWEIPIEYLRHGNNIEFDIYKIYPDLKTKDNLRRSAEAWMKWEESDNVNNYISLWNKLFWNFRSGCWTSSIEQGFDMMEGIVSIHTCNNRVILSLLFGFEKLLPPHYQMYNKIHEEVITGIASPELKSLPYDGQSTFWKVIPLTHMPSYFFSNVLLDYTERAIIKFKKIIKGFVR